MQSNCIEKRLRHFFYVYGRFIARHPSWFICLPLMLVLVLCTGFSHFQTEYDVEVLYTPDNARSKVELEVVRQLFPADDSVLRMTTLGEYGRVIVTAKTNGGDVLAKDVFREVEQLDRYIRAITVEVSGSTFNYSALCARIDDVCTEDALLRLRKDMHVDLRTVAYPVHTVSLPSMGDVKVFLGATISGVEHTAEGDTTATAWQLFYYLHPETEHRDVVRAWQSKFLTTLAVKTYTHIHVARFTAHSIEDELARNVGAVQPLFGIMFATLVSFSVVSCMSTDWVRSKPLLGLLGVVSSGLAVVSSFGLVLHCGLPFVDIVALSPFLILGIGVDDMFVMVAAWRQTNFRWTMAERMGSTFSEAATSITITSLTNALSIGIGAATHFQSVRVFCVYTSVAVIFDYFFKVTFFAACIVLTGRREAANLHALTFRKAVPKSVVAVQTGPPCIACPARPTGLKHTLFAPVGFTKHGLLFRLFCTGGYTDTEMKEGSNTGDLRVMAFFRDSLGGLMSTRPFKLCLAVVYAIYLAVAVWGCFNINEGLTLDKLASDGSYVNEFYALEIKYFRKYGPAVNVIVGAKLDLWQADNRTRVDQLVDTFEASDCFHGADVTIAWTRDFRSFTGDANLTAGEFSSELNAFLHIHESYTHDVNVQRDSGRVEQSRFFVFAKDIDSSQHETDLMVTARRIADDNVDLNVTVFHPTFIFYDQYIAVWPNTRQNLIAATVAMFAVALVLMPPFACSLLVTLSIVSTCVGVLGYMTWWDVNLNTVSMINIVMCTGFCVDFAAHVVYAFALTDDDTGDQRMRNALYKLGFPVAQGAMSTILAVAPLGFASCYVFRSFFRTMFLVVVFSAFHGLFVIPALLSVVWPNPSPKYAVVAKATKDSIGDETVMLKGVYNVPPDEECGVTS